MMEETGMKETVKKGKTVEEAIELALEEIGASREDVEIEVVSEGSKGLFGIGSKEAEVKVSLKECAACAGDAEAIARDFIENVLEKLGMDASLTIETEGDRVNVDISGENMGIIIGRRGETLSSLQYLTNLVVNRKVDDYTKVSIDTENYKQKREAALIKLAEKTAEKVLKYRRSFTLEPMNPYERKVIHSALQENDKVTTYSTGSEPMRKVVVALNKNNEF